MAFRDRYGYELTTASAEAADAYGRGIDLSLSSNAGAEEAIDAALAGDPDFALAHVAKARQAQFLGDMPAMKAGKERAAALTASTTAREQQHIAALVRAMDGDGPGATALIKEHVQEFPRDAYLLSQVTGPFSLIGFGGGPDWRVEQFEVLAPLESAYGDDWWFLSTFAFAHNELYHFEVADRLVRRSLELNARSGHGAHTFSHVMFETGDLQSGAAFLESWLPGFERSASLFSHLWWHKALFALKAGDSGPAEAIYRETLSPAVCPGVPVIAMADAASLTWRCDLYGLARPEGSREELRDFAAKAFARPGITFADVHAALAYAAAGDTPALEALTSALRRREADGKQPAGRVVVAIVEAITAYAEGDFERAVAALEPFEDQVVRIGGSNAQREVIEDTLLQAYVRAGRHEQAEAMLKKRLARRHTPLDAQLAARLRAA